MNASSSSWTSDAWDYSLRDLLPRLTSSFLLCYKHMEVLVVTGDVALPEHASQLFCIFTCHFLNACSTFISSSRDKAPNCADIGTTVLSLLSVDLICICCKLTQYLLLALEMISFALLWSYHPPFTWIEYVHVYEEWDKDSISFTTWISVPAFMVV